jgi:hypothetical protein
MNQQIQVQIKSVNGERDVTINHNGRVFRFRSNGGGIAVQRPDGKGGIKKDRYKDMDELKQKDSEAHNLYKTFAAPGDGIQIRLRHPFHGIPGLQVPPRIELRQQPTKPPAPDPVPPKQAPKASLENIIEV